MLAWVNAQPRWARVLIVLFNFFSAGLVYSTLFLPLSLLVSDDFFQVIVPTSIAFSFIVSAGVAFVYRAIRKTKLDWLGFSLLIPLAIPLAFAYIMVAVSIDDVVKDSLFWCAAIGFGVLSTLLSIGLLWAALQRVAGFDGSRDAAREAVNLMIGIGIIAIFSRLLVPTGMIAELPYYSSAGPVFAGIASLIHFALRRDAVVLALWPVSALLGLVVLRLMDREDWVLSLAARFADHKTDVLELSQLMVFGLSVLVVLACTLLWAVSRRNLADPNRRADALARRNAFLTSEFVGNGVTMKLERRFQYIWRDFFLFAGMCAFLGYAALKGDLFTDVDTSKLATFGLYLVLVGIVIMLWFGLPLRIFARRRFRFITVFLVPVVTTILTGSIAAGLINGLSLDDGASLTTVVVLLMALPLPIMVIQSFLHLDRERLIIAVLAIFGYLLSDMVFTTFLGREAAEAFKLGLEIGDIGALLSGLALLAVFLANSKVPGVFLVWPIGAVAGGLLLRLFIVAQTRLNETAETVNIETGLGEVLLAAGFGAFVGYLALILKRIYYDKDPDSRSKGIRLRGGVTILHAITPLLVFAFVLSGLNAFVGRAQIDSVKISANATRIGESVVKIGDEVLTTVSTLDAEADALILQAQTAVGEATALGREVGKQLEAAAEEAVEGAKRVGAAALADVAEEGKKLASEVGEHLSDAISLPPIDLGLFEIEWPDLGIGDAIKDMFGGLFDSLLPDLDISGIFSNIMAKGLSNIEKEFAAPLARAEAMQNRLEDFVEDNRKQLNGSLDRVTTAAKDATAKVQAELTVAEEQFRQMAINVTSLLYSLLVFLSVILIATVIMMLWRALNGLFIMLDRIKSGWSMLIHEEEAQAEQAA